MNKKKTNSVLIIAIIIAFIALSAASYARLNSNDLKNDEEINDDNNKILVETLYISPEKDLDLYLETVASIEPQTKVDVVAMGSGMVKSLPFDVGDNINNSQILAYLSSGLTQTSFLNAQTNYYNMLSNLESVKRSTAQQVSQAEIGVRQAEEAVSNAQNALNTAEKNYETSLNLQAKNQENLETTAITSFSSYLLTIKDSLEDINYIINAETGEQLPGISQTLSAKDFTALNIAKNTYLETKREYNIIKNLEVNKDNLENSLENIIRVIKLTKNTINNTIAVLDSTVSSSHLSQTSLDAQRQSFSGLYSQIIGTLQSAENSLNNLKTLKINQKKELISLENSIQSTKNQLNLAELSANNALVTLQSSQQAKQQQILAASSQVDNALGQLNLNQEQLSNLVIKAPISGQITAKTVEIGTELNPGQKIAEIAKLDILKIEANISPDSAVNLSIGQKIIINNEIETEIGTISPNADPITKKIKIEASIDNSEKKLTPGTFINIKIRQKNSKTIENGIVKIPLEAVNITQTENYVFLATESEDGQLIAKKSKVTLGENEKNLIEISSGIKANDLLIVSGSKLLQDGDLIITK